MERKYLDLIDYWTRKKIPYVFDETLSLYQLVRKTIFALNEMIADQNELKEAIIEFIDLFESDLQNTITEILEQWELDGKLETIINQALFESKADREYVDVELGKKTNNTDFIALETEVGILKNRVYDSNKFGLEPNTDITTQLQSLIDLVHSNGGGTIFLRNGHYQISTSSTTSYGVLLKDNVTIIGENKNNTVIYPNNVRSGNGLIYGINSKNVSIQNITIDGNYVPHLYKSTMIRISAGEDIRIKNVNMINVMGSCIRVSDCSNFNLTDLFFKDIDGNEHPGSGVGGQCIYAQNLKGGLISNVEAHNIGDHVIYLETSVGGSGGDFTLENIRVYGSGMNGATNGAAINVCNDLKNFNINNCVLTDVTTGMRFTDNGGSGKNPSNFNVSNINIASTTVGAGITIAGAETGTRDNRFYANFNNITISKTGDIDTNRSPYGIRINDAGFIQFNNITMLNTGYSPIHVDTFDNIKFNNCQLMYALSTAPSPYEIVIGNANNMNRYITFTNITIMSNAGRQPIFNSVGTHLTLMGHNFNSSTITNEGTLRLYNWTDHAGE